MNSSLRLGRRSVSEGALLLLSWVVVAVIGCDSPDKKSSHQGKPDNTVAENSEFLRPDIFSAAPEKVEGCVGLYTYDSLNIPFENLDVDKGKKIVVTKTGEFAFFRLHGKDFYLHYDSAKSGPIDKKTAKEVYRGNEYTVVLTTQEVRTEGETQWSSGTLEIIRGDKHFRIKVRGLSGC
ncbi:MAG TPA: hypothetical protein VMH27_06475 [Puia sp.]|nr:hypothetical protein [Puia sp.]